MVHHHLGEDFLVLLPSIEEAKVVSRHLALGCTIPGKTQLATEIPWLDWRFLFVFRKSCVKGPMFSRVFSTKMGEQKNTVHSTFWEDLQ